MRRIVSALLVAGSLLMPFAGNAKGNKIDFYGRKHYRIAIGVTNPLSAYTKYGGFFEERNGDVSTVLSYTKYTGAYPGKQFGFGIEKYLRTRKRDQYYIYFKGVFGDAGFDTRKLSLFGDQSNILIGTFDENLKYKSGNGYVGGGFGFGKRYNFNSLFIKWNFGVKACGLIGEIPDTERNLYRLMFATGPASIIEFNVKAGIQF